MNHVSIMTTADENALKTQYSTALYEYDDPAQITSAQNPGYIARCKKFAKSSVVQVQGKLCGDLFNLKRFMPAYTGKTIMSQTSQKTHCT